MSNSMTTEGPDDLKLSVPFHVARTCGIVMVCVPTIVGNSLSIIITHRVSELAESTKVLMTCLAVCDLIIGVLGVAHVVASAMNFWPFGQGFCMAHAILTLFSVTMSIVFITFLNVERYVAVTMPLRFPSLFQRQRVIVVVTIGSVFCLLVTASFVCFYERPVVLLNTAALFCNFDFSNVLLRMAMLCLWVVTPLITISVMYYRLIRISRYHARRIQPGQLVRVGADLQGALVHGSDRKALRTFIAVTAAFAFCWTPYTVSGAYAALSGTALSELLELVVFWLAASNSFLNVFIYCLFNRPFRKTAKKFIGKKLRECGWRCSTMPRQIRCEVEDEVDPAS
ncbi:octopamine receptor 1-like [Acanthaster planci]|uniref:Octopamine receptor 1-like n=1 Tax=Acanthaster planci TaxID=133434 RepID=A0A8B7YWT1_ACAPL|nr:octopamine receptor 1-like [Acanthaster planci]